MTITPGSRTQRCSTPGSAFEPSASSPARCTASPSWSMSRSAIRSSANPTSWWRKTSWRSPASRCRRCGSTPSRRTSPRSCTRTRCRARVRTRAGRISRTSRSSRRRRPSMRRVCGRRSSRRSRSARPTRCPRWCPHRCRHGRSPTPRSRARTSSPGSRSTTSQRPPRPSSTRCLPAASTPCGIPTLGRGGAMRVLKMRPVGE